MVSISIIALATIAAASSFSNAQSARDTLDFKMTGHYIRLQQSFAARISCGESQGTAFIAGLTKIPDIIFAVTNKHVLRNKSEASIVIPLGKEAGIDTTIQVTANIEFCQAKDRCDLKTGVTVTWPGLDIAAIIIELEHLKKLGWPDLGEIRFLNPKKFTQWADLIPGQTINFTGFPLGNAVAGMYPFVRDGIIAGVDSLGDTIFVDGQFFDGSSGSPVFLDRRDSACRLPYKNGRYFVGIVTSYVPYKKFLQNTKTKEVEMMQTENSGIGIVIPSATLYSLLTKLTKVPVK